ncbi:MULTISPECIES: hypothetical protein [unclassified Herbaspirillum]|uniref:hypothetical protein n=1 Tax=unclassified Herbaspirillum TaxID=2624150 RepID=UPI000C0ACA02|nr:MULTISPECIES: hypothetical protein [unclassified Herbaspirillum]MAF04941.1 hypothetical protein [Herbaspirillum sp.]MBO18489.1 hypothetical protein [Herbaspirillum sp.]|tara:strand:- start:4168 stop:4392 length:225 start_codon:yes stop_codon:yes gene_type:complete
MIDLRNPPPPLVVFADKVNAAAEVAFHSRQPKPPSLAAVAAHFRAIEQARITALHQQVDTEHWHGQIFKRLEEA